jgi:hypothetical protein
MVAVQLEFESMVDYENWKTAFYSDPESVEWNNKFTALVFEGGTNELWRLADEVVVN